MCRCGRHLQQQHYGKRLVKKKQLHVGILFTFSFSGQHTKLSTLCSNVVAMWSRVDQGPGIHVVNKAVQNKVLHPWEVFPARLCFNCATPRIYNKLLISSFFFFFFLICITESSVWNHKRDKYNHKLNSFWKCTKPSSSDQLVSLCRNCTHECMSICCCKSETKWWFFFSPFIYLFSNKWERPNCETWQQTLALPTHRCLEVLEVIFRCLKTDSSCPRKNTGWKQMYCIC